MFAALRCVILSSDLKFSRRLKSGLDETRRVSAIAFTSPENALAHIKTAPQDIIIVDVGYFDYDMRIVYQKLVDEQPKLGFLLLTGQQSDTQNNSTLRTLSRDTRVRHMLPVLEEIKAVVDTELSDTAVKQPLTDNVDVDASLLSSASDVDTDSTPLSPPLRVSSQDDARPTADATFQKLAREEPPLPDDATISDLQKSFLQQGKTEFTVSASSKLVPVQIADSKPTPASLILESTAGDTTPLDQLAIETFVRNLEDKLAGFVRPLPSWERSVDRANLEPTFLDDLSSDTPLEYTSGTTIASDVTRAETLDDGQDSRTELQVPVQRTHPIDDDLIDTVDETDIDTETVDESPPANEASSLADIIQASEKTNASIADSMLDGFTIDEADDPLIMSQPITPIIDVDFADGDSQLVQIASVITQMSLETAASATVLLWQQHVIAVAGEMPRSDIDELLEQEPRLLEPTDLPQKMFFVTLNSSGTNYMVMMMPTVDELLLVLIFSGNQPLGAIRRQTSRLINALATVPETINTIPSDSDVIIESEDEVLQDDSDQITISPLPEGTQVDDTSNMPLAPDDTSNMPLAPDVAENDTASVHEPVQDWGKRQSYTFVWVLQNNHPSITPNIAESLVQQLDHQYAQQGWQIGQIDVQEDYVQMQASVPGEMPPHNYVRGLMQTSSDIVHPKDQSGMEGALVWSDSYLILSPARQLETTEIQRFLNFVRH